jgi:sigma-E factor negative regulatory protein RseA
MVILMPENLNQKISQFIDNELDEVDALYLLKKMQIKPGLQGKLNRYQVIGQVIKGDIGIVPEADFVNRISLQIQQEPIYLLPKIKVEKMSYKKPVAIAASLFIVAIIVGHSVTDKAQPTRVVSTLQVADNNKANNKEVKKQEDKPLEAIAQKAISPQAIAKVSEDPLNKQISDYLQAHNGNLDTNNEPAFQPYARVSSYNQE